MRFDPPLKIAATAVWLPDECETVTDAVRAGRLEPERARKNGYVQLPVSDIPPPQMAVRAAGQAIEAAGMSPEDITLLVHAWTYYQGQDYWEPVHYILNELSLYRAVPLGVSLGCNGGFAAIEAAASRMLADPDMRDAVVTTGERFCLPRFDRWRANLDVGYGDSGTAVVLSAREGELEVLSTANTTDPRLEAMYRGSAPWNAVPFEHSAEVDIRSQLRSFVAAGHGPAFAATAATAIRKTVMSALSLAGIFPGDRRIRVVAPPRFGAELITHSYVEVLSGLTKGEILNLGRGTGHLGAGDLAANLADITARGLLDRGQIGVFLSATAGFTWSCMVVRRT
jgi:3-oxoacyl-[acyl-carrier-protein] synthase-3